MAEFRIEYYSFLIFMVSKQKMENRTVKKYIKFIIQLSGLYLLVLLIVKNDGMLCCLAPQTSNRSMNQTKLPMHVI